MDITITEKNYNKICCISKGALDRLESQYTKEDLSTVKNTPSDWPHYDIDQNFIDNQEEEPEDFPHCPHCGEFNEDYLIWQDDDDMVICQICGNEFTP